MPTAYGDSFGGVQSAELADRSLTQNALQGAMARFLAMLGQRQHLSQVERDLQMRSALAGQNLSLAQQQLDQQKQRYAEESAHAAQALDFAKQKHAEDLAFSLKSLEAQAKAHPDERQREFDFNSVLSIAQTGRAPGRESLEKYNFSPLQMDVIERTNAAARDLLKQNYDSASALSHASQESIRLQKEIDEVSKRTRFTPWNHRSADLAKLTEEKQKHDSYIKSFEKNNPRVFSQLVAPDPETGYLRPIVPRPPEDDEPTGTAHTMSRIDDGSEVTNAPAPSEPASQASRSFDFGTPGTDAVPVDFSPVSLSAPTQMGNSNVNNVPVLPAPAPPKRGDRAKQNDKIYVFDGTTWNEVAR